MASQLIEEVTAPAQSDSLEVAREICADGAYFPNNLRIKGSSACACAKVMAGSNNKTRRSAVEDLLRHNNRYII